ncbi:MAG: IS21 family transposase [Planctomycetota bacterium]
MRTIREILRQRWVLGRSHRAVARSTGRSVGAVHETLRRARAAGVDWARVEQLSDPALEGLLYRRPGAVAPRRARPQPDCVYLHTERRKPGVTLELLHLEYLERHPDGYRYTQFCEIYRQWLRRRGLTMRQVHRAGEKSFVDYAGKRPCLTDPVTGARTPVELFLMALGASSYTFAEATRTQQLPDWIASHTRAFAFFGGCPAAVVPDQLRSGVTTPCRYEPGVHRIYADLAAHYGTTILPARPARPRDKAKAEVTVQIAERWIVARLRHEIFFTLAALNARIAERLVELNAKPMRHYGGASRRDLFERLDRPALRPLPAEPFEYAEWKRAKVNLDYHILVAHHAYSVPHALVHETVEVRLTATTVEVFHRGQRVAAHRRSHRPGGFTTAAAHMPKAHRAHAAWRPSRFIRWAATIGPQTAALITAILADRPHPEQGYRSCLGILRLAKRYEPGRLEAACTRALAAGARSYRHVDAILKRGLDQLTLGTPPQSDTAPLVHENVRGPEYYQ